MTLLTWPLCNYQAATYQLCIDDLPEKSSDMAMQVTPPKPWYGTQTISTLYMRQAC